MKALLLALCAGACALLCLCGPPSSLTGGTSSSENAKVKGTIIDMAGAAAPGARVLLIPAAFNPAEDTADKKITRDTTDASGAYSFASVAPGVYNIQANNPANGTSLLITGIECKKKDSITVSADTLKQPGTVIIALDTAVSPGAKVYIPGTTTFEIVPAAATSVTLDSVPWGSIPSILMKDQGGAAAITLGNNISVFPADTTYPALSAKLFINTSATGANIQNPVMHFPLLVRLTAADIDFAQFRADGGNIRFTKADGTPLKYEIAQWDTALKQAAVWVSLDTVLGNASTQFITMTWGYSGIPSASNSAGVFDTAFGFSGVWHLEESTIAAFKDATQNSAIGQNFITSVDRNGIAGFGRNFNGTDYILVSKHILNMAVDDFTIALWLNPRLARGVIVSKDTAIAQDSCAKRLYLGDAGDSSGLHPSFGGKGSGTAVSDASLSLNAWHHLVFSWSQASKTATFFIDGVKTGLQTNTLTLACPDNPKDRLIFGYDGGYLFGYCDEIHLSGNARSEDWVKLSYENQRTGQKLVSIVK